MRERLLALAARGSRSPMPRRAGGIEPFVARLEHWALEDPCA
jgi:hypothetical protein